MMDTNVQIYRVSPMLALKPALRQEWERQDRFSKEIARVISAYHSKKES